MFNSPELELRQKLKDRFKRARDNSKAEETRRFNEAEKKRSEKIRKKELEAKEKAEIRRKAEVARQKAAEIRRSADEKKAKDDRVLWKRRNEVINDMVKSEEIIKRMKEKMNNKD